VNLIDVMHTINQSSMAAYGLSDLAVGTVTRTAPLEVTLRESMAPLPQEVLWLTEPVIEKKLPVLAHRHENAGLRHRHTLDTAEGSFSTSDALTPDAYTSDQRLDGIVCYEDGKPLPVENGFIVLNRGLKTGDRVLLLRVMRGQQFIILSRIFERGSAHGNAARI